MVHLLALGIALVAQATPAPSAAPSPAAGAQAPAGATAPRATPSPTIPISVATPGLLNLPVSSNGLVLPTVPAIAPGFKNPLEGQPHSDLVGTNAPFVGLSIEDAVAMALARNTDLSVSQSNRRVAGFQIVAAKGAYDLRFQVQPSVSYQNQADPSTFQAGPDGYSTKQTTFGASAALSGLTASGGQYQISSSATRIHNDSTFNNYDPFYQTSLGFNFTQPLARGLAIDETRRQIQLAKINQSLSSDTLLQTASSSIDNVLNTYYDLISAWRNVAIQEDALRQAKAQSESNSRLVRRGQAAPVDVVESDTQVQTFQGQVFAAIQNVTRLQNQLKQLLLSNPSDPIWTANLVPTSAITDVPPEPALNDVIVAALNARPEVSQYRDQLRQANVNVTYYKDQNKPQLDLVGNVTENGFAGRPFTSTANPFFGAIGQQVVAINQLIAISNAQNPGMPLMPLPQLSTNYQQFNLGGIGQAYSNMFNLRYPQYQISMNLSFPLRNRTAEANLSVAKEQLSQLMTQEVALVQRIELEARNAVENYRTARAQVIAAGASRDAAEKVAASEVRKFRAGESTTFLVLQRQVQLANARGQELAAQTQLQKSVVELDRVTGAILTNNHVDISKLGGAPYVKTPLSGGAPIPAIAP